MRLQSHTYKPRFVPRQDSGDFPHDLLFGFETEMSIWKIDADSTEETINTLIKDTEKFFYIKYDGSIDGGSTGAEINSHPFNWDYILNHRDYLVKLTDLKHIHGDRSGKFLGSNAQQFRINRSCGFHIHISKDYFSDMHLKNIVRFFYNNPDFISNISQRPGTESLRRFARPTLKKGKTVEDFLSESQLWSDPSYRYTSLNISGDKTIEIRIFQGTLNIDCIMAYLEFALAVVIFTGNVKSNKINVKNFMQYINENNDNFGNFIKLYNGEISWKE